MPKIVTVYAADAMHWKGASYSKGAPIRMSGVDAIVQKKKGFVSLKALAVEPIQVENDSTQRRRYRRKDLQPQETQAMVAEEPQVIHEAPIETTAPEDH